MYSTSLRVAVIDAVSHRCRQSSLVVLCAGISRSSPDVGAPTPDVAHVLLVGDETSAPAVRGILASLRPDVRAHVLVEADDPADAPVGDVPGTVHVEHVPRARRRGAERAVLGAVRGWVAEHGRPAASAGDGFYAWCATESATVARVRAELVAAGVARSRVHAQGYWHDRARPDAAVTRGARP